MNHIFYVKGVSYNVNTICHVCFYFRNDDLFDLDAALPDVADFTDFDYEKIFTLTSELIALEIINRLCITIVEVIFVIQQS